MHNWSGKKHTEATKLKMSLSSKGKPKSEQHKINMSLAHKGHVSWNKGKTNIYSEESRNKMGARGAKHKNWKGGITPINDFIRNSARYKYWRKECFERDCFKCQKYGTSGGDLRVHHINNFSEFPELRFDINNGITLSEKAHIEFHKKYGTKNNTKDQLLEFLTVK
jgi:hypothetical protein